MTETALKIGVCLAYAGGLLTGLFIGWIGGMRCRPVRWYWRKGQ